MGIVIINSTERAKHRYAIPEGRLSRLQSVGIVWWTQEIAYRPEMYEFTLYLAVD